MKNLQTTINRELASAREYEAIAAKHTGAFALNLLENARDCRTLAKKLQRKLDRRAGKVWL